MLPIPVLNGTLAVGVTNFGPVTPAVGSTIVQLALDRTNLTLLTQPVDMALELSIDSGLTWVSRGSCTVPAGVVKTGIDMGSPSNIVLLESLMEIKIPSADVNTRLRGSVTTREIIVTTLTLRIS